MSEPSNFETSHEVTEIDILEPANTIENLIKEPSPHNQESKSEVGNTSMPPNKQEPKLKKKTPSVPKKTPTKPAVSEKGCYLVYDSSSNGRLMLYYSQTLVPNAVGFWSPSPKHTIQGFKFKRNMGRSELIGNCAAGVTGRKNYYSGWCQFIRAAKALHGTVTVFPRLEKEGLDVDIYAYFKPPFEVDGRQTIPLEENVPFQLSYISAVACLPRHSTLFDLCFQSRVFLPCLHSPHQ